MALIDSELATGRTTSDDQQVTIDIRHEERQQQTPRPPPAISQFCRYFICMSMVALLGDVILLGLIKFLPAASSENKMQFFSKKLPLKTKLDGLFMMMSITTLCVALLASAILVFAEYYLRSRMKDIHHAILKTIGGFGYFLALFSIISRLVILFDPTHDWNILHNHTWIRYLAISICLCVTLVAFYFFWKKVCKHQQEEHEEGSISFAVLGFFLLLEEFVVVLLYSKLISWQLYLCLQGVILVTWMVVGICIKVVESKKKARQAAIINNLLAIYSHID